MRTYFFPSSDESYLIFTETPSLPMKNKIDKFCRYSEWTTSLLEEGKLEIYDKLHGYIEDGKCYDNQYIFYEQNNEKQERSKKQKQERFDKFKDKINKGIKTLEGLYSKIRRYRDCKNYIKRMEETLNKGYVLNTQNIGGSKRARRYKKNARLRYLTDHEIDNYKEKIATEERNKVTYKAAINPIKTIEDVLFTFGKTVKDMKQEAFEMNHIVHNYGDTVFLFSIFEETLEKFDVGIYRKVLTDYKEVLRIDKEEKVQKKKVTRNKTRVYIDENGVEHIVKEDIEQIIRTL
jgi:hypothetical protein